ncbi:MAG: hypothetical protein AAF441_15980, partial [Pseudomonadota bacterium]
MAETINTPPPAGQFPYPLTEDAEESAYLNWLRNNSNYMIERGLPDYARSAAVLVRGILLNFLNVLPVLIVATVLVAWTYGDHLRESAAALVCENADFTLLCRPQSDDWKFAFTPWVVGIAFFHVLTFPLVTRLWRIWSHRKALKSGGSSTVKFRDKYELSFGYALLAIALVFAFELLPVLGHEFHKMKIVGLWGFTVEKRGLLAVGVVVVLVFLLSFSNVLSGAQGIRRTLILSLIGFIGLLVPLIFALYILEFVVYGQKYPGYGFLALFVLPILLFLLSILAIVIGIFKGTLGWRGAWRLTRTIGLMIIVLIGVLLFVMISGLEDFGEWTNGLIALLWAFEIFLFCWLTLDVNLTSIHGLYRDRLASAYLVGHDTGGAVDIEEDVNLQDICRHEAGSTAPYHLINVALNLQGSKAPEIRDRSSDFFVFSKRFVGGKRTGYCRSDTMEQVYPQLDLATAMAVSAAAASPNMGSATNPAMVALLTLLNVRLGFWVPNPGQVEELRRQKPAPEQELKQKWVPGGYAFPQVFAAELAEVEARWDQVYGGRSQRKLAKTISPTIRHRLVGLGLSGGGIRSATINLGIVQVLHKHGIFDHVDYLSTVSGGGYLGSSISTLMRHKFRPTASWSGTVHIETGGSGEKIVKICGVKDGENHDVTHVFSKDACLAVSKGSKVEEGDPLIYWNWQSRVDGTVEAVDGNTVTVRRNSDSVTEDDSHREVHELEDSPFGKLR